MIDLSKHIQEGARLELEAMERLAEECSFCSSMSAQHSAQAMQIDELKRDLAAANARVDAVSDALDYLKGLTPQQYADLRKDAERLAWIEALANTWRDEKCYEYCFRTPRLSLRESIDAAIAAKEKPNG